MVRRPAATLLHLGPGLANSLSNLHNARRAGTPIVNLIGEMATWHLDADPPLAMDIQALAGTVGSVITSSDAKGMYADTLDAVRKASAPAAPGDSRVVTLVLPMDAQREAAGESPAKTAAPPPAPVEVDQDAVNRAASALKEHGAGACLFAGGDLLVVEADGGVIASVGKVSAATKCTLMCKNNFARVDRGHAAPRFVRCPYFPDGAKKAFDDFKAVVFLGEKPPVAMFGYEDGISQVCDDKGGAKTVVKLPASALPALIAACDAKWSQFEPRPMKRPNVPANPTMKLVRGERALLLLLLRP